MKVKKAFQRVADVLLKTCQLISALLLFVAFIVLYAILKTCQLISALLLFVAFIVLYAITGGQS